MHHKNLLLIKKNNLACPSSENGLMNVADSFTADSMSSMALVRDSSGLSNFTVGPLDLLFIGWPLQRVTTKKRRQTRFQIFILATLLLD